MYSVIYSWPWKAAVVLTSACLLSACDPYAGRRAEAAAQAKLPPRPAVSTPLAEMLKDVRLGVVQSTLTPFLLLRTESRVLHLFVPSTSTPGVVPHYVGYGAGGPKILTNVTSVSLTNLQERWLVAWFNGALGWEKQDCPIGIQLQVPARRVTLDGQGLMLEFDEPAGHVGLHALYGSFSLPTSVAEASARSIPNAEFKRMPKTWDWPISIPREPLTRLRYWGYTLGRYPYAAWALAETASGGLGVERWHVQFDWMDIPFRWDTARVVQAPLSPDVGRWVLRHPEQIDFSSPFYDMQIQQPGGPVFAVSDTEAYAIVPRGAVDRVAELKRAGLPALAEKGAGPWVEWNFSSDPTRLTALKVEGGPGGPRLVWNSQPAAVVVPVPLGGIRIAEPLEGNPETAGVNQNTTVIRWR